MKINHLLLAGAIAYLSFPANGQEPVRIHVVGDSQAKSLRLAQSGEFPEPPPSPFTPESNGVPQAAPRVLDPVPAPAGGGEYVPTHCDCGQCPTAAPYCGAEPSCGCGPSCEPSCGVCTGCADPTCCCGGCGCPAACVFPFARDVLNEVLPCNKCDCACCNTTWRLFPSFGPCNDWTVTGWLNAGFMSNASGATYNGPLSFNDRNEIQFNQAYGVLERKVNPSRGEWDLGGRIDLLYGSDYIYTQAAGLETQPNGAPRWNGSPQYGLAMPQWYLEIGVDDDLRMKLGHFYTIMGYESVMAPQNFFMSHAYTMQYGEPFTHTGMLFNYDWSERTSLYAGLVNGWDRLDGISDHLAFLGGVSYDPGGDYDVNFTMITGSEPDVTGVATSPRMLYSLVFNLQLTENFRYVMQHDHGWQQNFIGAQDVEWYGINQYLFYDLNDCWSIGGRFEWFRDDDGTRVAGVRPGNPYPGGSAGSFYEMSLGLNWRPHSNIVMRPELRWDWFDGVGTPPFNNNLQNNQFAGGLDFIVQW